MPGTFPSTPLASSMDFTSEMPTLVSTSHSLKRQTRSRGSQRFRFKLEYNNKTRDEMAPLIAFAMKQRGQFGTFSFTPPVLGVKRAGLSGYTTVYSNALSGREVVLSGGVSGQILLCAGDLISFGHGKAYMVVDDATADANGRASIAIEPALYAPVYAGTAASSNPVVVVASFAADLQTVRAKPGGRYDWLCELVEVLP